MTRWRHLARGIGCALATAALSVGPGNAHAVPGPRLPTGFVGYPDDSAMKFGIDLSIWAAASPSRESGIYVAYAQRSLWDLDNDGRPFRVENNFRPEVGGALGPDAGRKLLGAWPDGLAISTAFIHESNGLEGEVSRGWNRIAGGLHFGEEGAPLRASLLGWYAFRVEETMADITRDAGDGEVRIVADLSRVLSDSSLWIRSAFSPDARSDLFFSNLEVGLHVSPAFLPGWMIPRDDGPLVDLVIEWFTGSGEFLYDHAAQVNRIGVGIALRP